MVFVSYDILCVKMVLSISASSVAVWVWKQQPHSGLKFDYVSFCLKISGSSGGSGTFIRTTTFQRDLLVPVFEGTCQFRRRLSDFLSVCLPLVLACQLIFCACFFVYTRFRIVASARDTLQVVLSSYLRIAPSQPYIRRYTFPFAAICRFDDFRCKIVFDFTSWWTFDLLTM